MIDSINNHNHNTVLVIIITGLLDTEYGNAEYGIQYTVRVLDKYGDFLKCYSTVEHQPRTYCTILPLTL